MQLIDDLNGAVRVRGNCVFTGEVYTTAPILRSQIEAWQNGTLIQKAMPNVSSDDREFLMSGNKLSGNRRKPLLFLDLGETAGRTKDVSVSGEAC